MANANYQRGVRFERDIISETKSEGYETLRTAGSHGFADVIAINEKLVRLIQGKVTKDAKPRIGAYKADIAKILAIKCPPNVTRELWIKLDRQKPYKVLVL